mmetsp:Transcript_14536/g.22733  ORF Transcript_14536/g.22733 Transcript_14536/m.22733 type:complete len:215 (-) Transcript_14536:79-723(-)
MLNVGFLRRIILMRIIQLIQAQILSLKIKRLIPIQRSHNLCLFPIIFLLFIPLHLLLHHHGFLLLVLFLLLLLRLLLQLKLLEILRHMLLIRFMLLHFLRRRHSKTLYLRHRGRMTNGNMKLGVTPNRLLEKPNAVTPRNHSVNGRNRVRCTDQSSVHIIRRELSNRDGHSISGNRRRHILSVTLDAAHFALLLEIRNLNHLMLRQRALQDGRR